MFKGNLKRIEHASLDLKNIEYMLRGCCKDIGMFRVAAVSCGCYYSYGICTDSMLSRLENAITKIRTSLNRVHSDFFRLNSQNPYDFVQNLYDSWQ
jgi:hypothetical protein